MKLGKISKKIVSVICALALVVSSITAWDTANVYADEGNVIVGTKDEGRDALVAEIGNADINFALNKEASASFTSLSNGGGTDTSVLTDGNVATVRNTTTTVTVGYKDGNDKWIQVDLGKAYDATKIDRIAAEYYSSGTGPGSGYQIQYSVNGIDYITVKEVAAITMSGNYNVIVDKVSMTEEQIEAIPYARYVRLYVNMSGNNNNNGLQVLEMGVLTDGVTLVQDVDSLEPVVLDDPTNLIVTSSDYNQLEYIFEGAKDHDDYTYIAYVDNKAQDNVEPNKKYIVSGLLEGNHEVKIVSFKAGDTSMGIKETVLVAGTKELLTSERNMAVGKDVTPSGVRESDNPANVTDGVLTSIFRLPATDTTGFVTIDFGDYYNPDILERTVALYADTRFAQDYTIDISLDGNAFTTVATAKGNSNLQTALLDVSDYTEQAFRYVRFSLANPVAPQGFQMYELGVIVKEGADLTPVKVDTLEDPASLTVTSSDYNQLEYIFEAAKGHDDYTYIAYVDNIDQGLVEPGQLYVVNNLAPGLHTVKVMSHKDNIPSVGIKQTVEISTPKELINTDRNIALGKTATMSSLRVEQVTQDGQLVDVYDNPVNLTDGILNNQCRTIQSDTEANVVIDLEYGYKAKLLEIIAMQYNNGRYAKEYSVEFSSDGENYENVCTATGNSEFQYSKVNVKDYTQTTVRYVKINVADPVGAGYGFQFNEIAVITKTKTLDDADFTLNQSEYTYTGSEISPDFSFTYGGKELVEDVDYTVSYEENINVGTAKAIITGAGSYTGVKEIEYDIVKADIAQAQVSSSFNDKGEAIVKITYNDIELVKDTDYTYETSKNADGDMLVSISAAGNNFKGTASTVIPVAGYPVFMAVNITVESTETNKIDVSFENPDTFAGDRQKYDIYVDDEIVSTDVSAGDYTYDNINAGNHKVVIIAKLNDKTAESEEKEVNVSGVDIAQFSILVADIGYIYSGSPIEAQFVVVDDGQKELTRDVDYTVSFEENLNVGTAKIVVLGTGLYEGKLEGTFKINPCDISLSNINTSSVNTSYIYTGQPIMPAITVAGLVTGKDYKAEYENNVIPGTASIVITGLGNYTGKVVKTFKITKKPINSVLIKTTFAGNKLVVDVADAYHKMVKGVDYKYIAAQDAKGNIKITVEGIGNCYEGKVVKTISAKDNPNVGKPTVSTAVKKKASGKISIKLKKVTGAKKYQIQISATKNFKKVLVTKTVKKATVTIKNKKFAKKTKLYVRAKALKTVGRKTYKGLWSNVKKIKIKK